MEVAIGKCVDDLTSDSAKSAECAGWVKALNLAHLVHIRTASHLDQADSCRSDGFTDVGPVVWEFEYTFKSTDEGKSLYIAGRLTGQWHLKPGMKI